MTDGNRGPGAGAPDAASVERMGRYVDARARRADERDRVADERDRIARQRDQLADERERIADVRAWQLSQARAPRPGDVERRRRETLRRAREAAERAGAQIGRLEAGLAREDAAAHREEDDLEYEMAWRELVRASPEWARSPEVKPPTTPARHRH